MIEKNKDKYANLLQATLTLVNNRGFHDTPMSKIAKLAGISPATIYLYFENKEALFAAIVLRGIGILENKYIECMEKQVPGTVKVALMGEAYYRFSQEQPDYLRLIHFYGSERFSKENPYTTEIGKGYGTCRRILEEAVREGIDDGTIRGDIDPFLISMYLMISFMGILSMEEKWKRVIETEGFSYEQYSREFFRFITPAISPGKEAHLFTNDGGPGPFSTH